MMQAGWAAGKDGSQAVGHNDVGGSAEDLVLSTFPGLDHAVEMHGPGHLGVFLYHMPHPVNYQPGKSLNLFRVLNG